MTSGFISTAARFRRTRTARRVAVAGRLLAALALLWALVLGCPTVFGQDAGEPPTGAAVAEEPAPSDEITVQRLEARVAELEQIAEPAEAEKTELTQLRSAVAALRQAAEAQAQTAQFQELMRTAPDRLNQINDELRQIEAKVVELNREAGDQWRHRDGR